MERLIRGCLIAGGHPAEVEALTNWAALSESGIEFRDEEDKRIFDYLSLFYRQMSAPPDLALVKEHFEKLDAVEVVDRLSEISKAQLYIRTNYVSILRSEQEQQRMKNFVLICRDASSIAEHGRSGADRRDPERMLRGPDDATEWLMAEMAKQEARSGAFEPVGPSMVGAEVEGVKYPMEHFKLAEGRPSALVGYAGSAKTYLAIELALAVASGRSTCWGGLPVDLSGPVVHLDYEMGRKALFWRYQRIAHGMGLDLRNLRGRPPASLLKDFESWKAQQDELGNEDLLAVQSFPKTYLTTPGAEAALVKLCRGKALLVIDSFRAATAGAVDENSSEIRKYVDMLGGVSDATSCAVLLLHHERKSGKDGDASMKLQTMRGSSALADAFGATVHVEPLESPDTFKVTQGKVSMGRRGGDTFVKLEDCGGYVERHKSERGLAIAAATQSEIDAQLESDIELVLSAITKRGGKVASKEALHGLIGVASSRVVKAVSKMKERGVLLDTRTGYVIAPVPTVEDVLQ